MTANRKITQVKEIITTDLDTGHAVSKQEERTYSIPQEPSYVKFYLEDIGYIHGLTKAESEVLFSLSRLIGWDGVVSVSKTRFEKSIQPMIDIKYQTFKNTISKLVAKNIFTRVGRGELEANPYLFAKGEWSEVYKRRKEISLHITYDESGRRIFTEIK
ncbi:hypothetical protein ACU5EH_20620 [Aliivibrio salmonicida]|uniref:hypothetical protein n=1 Tax=Aliivibrio salmonicida TaxID=40269 RepID=UPI00406C6576